MSYALPLQLNMDQLTFTPTPLAGAIVVQPRIFHDARGYFYESYQAKAYQANGIDATFVQDNQAYSTKGALRGLHYQVSPHAQAKLVRVTHGRVLDVIVDIRPGSPTYGQWYSVELSADNHRQLYVPHGMAHGYQVLSDTAIFNYKCDSYYHRDSEGGVRFDDPRLNITWQGDPTDFIVSEKDLAQPLFGQHRPYE